MASHSPNCLPCAPLLRSTRAPTASHSPNCLPRVPLLRSTRAPMESHCPNCPPPRSPPAFIARPDGIALSQLPPRVPLLRSTRAPMASHCPNCPPPRPIPAFNARPNGATSSQPRASERSERHPGLGRSADDTPPEGAKATTEAVVLPILRHHPQPLANQFFPFFFCSAFALHYICFANIGCGSAKQKKNGFFFCSAFALHYICFANIGCGSAKQKKNGFFFCSAFALHYICTQNL